jgi:hypothetical protein
MARKTEMEIETDVFRIVRDSTLKTAIGGTIYRDGMRPKGAKTEDAVVKFLTGTDGQIQEGYVLVHVYVPDVPSAAGDGELVKNIARIKVLQSTINDQLSDIDNNEYLFEIADTPKTYEEENIHQHFINVRIHYKRITF